MIIRKAHKFRLKVTPEVEKNLVNFAGQTRFVYNKALELNAERLKRNLPIIRYAELCGMLRLWKQTEERGFLQESPSQILQQKLKDLDRAFMDGFDKKQPNKRMPRKHKRGVHDSFRFPQGFKFDNRRVFLPKIGWVGFFKSQQIVGTPKNVTVSRSGNNWFISVQVEIEECIKTHPSQSAVGIDVGIEHFAALSSGELIPGINVLRKREKQLSKLQKKLSRAKKFSKNWCKLKMKLRSLYSKMANSRRDFLHKLSTTLSNSHATVVVEDLKIKNMSASARGTVESPGTNVRAKSGLNKSILDQGWGELFRQLEYKLNWVGGKLIRVNPKHSSQTCSQCDYVYTANRESRSSFQCQSCGYVDHADINASRVILKRGLACVSEEARNTARAKIKNGRAFAGLACESNSIMGRKQESTVLKVKLFEQLIRCQLVRGIIPGHGVQNN